MGYFDEEENKDNEEISGASALADGVMDKEDRAAQKARLKEEKEREKELRKREKLEKKLEKKKAKGLFVDDIEEKMSGLAKPDDISVKTPSEDVDGLTDKASEITEAVERAGSVEKSEAAEKTEEPVAATDENGAEKIAELSDAEEEESGNKKKKKKKQKEDIKPQDVNIVRDLLSLILYIGIVIVICFLIVTYVGRRTSVHGDSMNPTLESGDSVWVNMLAYKFGDPERYDIIVFPYADDVHYIKRIIGLPGETIQIEANGDILINGKVLQEPVKYETIRTQGVAAEPITLGPDEYFVLGDNRVNSKDSRWPEVGNIKREKIIGKAVFRLTPLKKFGKIS